ncbi:MAG: hypothetical protein A2600_07215 [Candidatus Lambdaproteobacteria bacterium RIFOXYD1_FULL_56_27]|uniref:Uncharacterized protein n=1 Tax=Candidatus Lambdaproteobacteria bacterium RIFOXYD2_FULL_56_26 TaxID=1817773 RepID=A0A1F6GQ34_9PROT|nr:MAG: hypothetical protein A2557_05875 [Candidatus Lambdaproteobacteria bacterium RIFOXYD2_FULL_56_26]OGH03721.1 MAG: hypothetical protein A2426_00665 [Candidatus Lambdaproteobacteria bacterium RIFOXYC1_FULL_56_13]OGH07305.1 MAG: hypothetical protein A2600_07215 [Candidatus Lambdaproteobacteria bacterium RIFOXYD1_FULL_56_27]
MQEAKMNTLGYLSFFDGLAEKSQGSFVMERVASGLAAVNEAGDLVAYRCQLVFRQGCLESLGQSRKDALVNLYKQCRRL